MEKKGIHRPEYIRVLSDEIVQKIADAGPEVTKIITIAPEKAEVKHLKTLKNAGIQMPLMKNVWKRKSILTVQHIYIMQ